MDSLSVNHLGKSFRVPRAPGDHDPRREHLSRRHDRFHALRDITFAVRSGETMGLVGHNGSGKSTLLKILAGVMTADSGGFTTQGRLGALLELGAGFHPDLSGIENIHLNGALLGLSPQQINRLLPEIIAFAELEHFMDLPVRHYSSGMQSRLGFAVATRLAPDILLMDETFATGDARFVMRALGHIAWMKSQGRTMMLVSHHIELLLELCDRVLWLDQGRLRMLGSPREVLAQYQQSQRRALRSGGGHAGAIGIHALFEPLQPDSGITFTAVTAHHSAGMETEAGPLELNLGETLELTIQIEHTAGPARPVVLETAWTRAGSDQVLAQSRTPAMLAADQSQTVWQLTFSDWNLTEGTYRAAIAVAPAAESVSPDSCDDACTWLARNLKAALVRTVTPCEFEVSAFCTIPARWEASSERKDD